MDIERGSLCPDNRSGAVRGGSAACSVTRWSFRFVTTGCCYLAAGPPSFLASSLPSLRRRGSAGGLQRGHDSRTHPRASANPLSRCRGSPALPSSPSRTSASFAHATVVPSQAPELPWSMISVRVRASYETRVRECERAICGLAHIPPANSPKAGPE